MEERRNVRLEKVVLDVLKPRDVSIVELGKSLGLLDGVTEVSIVVTEVDVKTETIKITMMGEELHYEDISEELVNNGCAIRSVDELLVKKIS